MQYSSPGGRPSAGDREVPGLMLEQGLTTTVVS